MGTGQGPMGGRRPMMPGAGLMGAGQGPMGGGQMHGNPFDALRAQQAGGAQQGQGAQNGAAGGGLMRSPLTAASGTGLMGGNMGRSASGAPGGDGEDDSDYDSDGSDHLHFHMCYGY